MHSASAESAVATATAARYALARPASALARALLALVAGALLAAAFAPLNLWPLAVLSPALLMWVWQGATPREAARLGFLTVAVDIPTIYGSALKRRSHFRPVADITRIVLMVAGKLLAWGMDPVGLWRSLTRPRLRDGSRPNQ